MGTLGCAPLSRANPRSPGFAKHGARFDNVSATAPLIGPFVPTSNVPGLRVSRPLQVFPFCELHALRLWPLSPVPTSSVAVAVPPTRVSFDSIFSSSTTYVAMYSVPAQHSTARHSDLT
ncbi:hypothetical protein ACCO45_006776 [Purpureocillium lilacinum]|uniref:Uncharacterized protein n=1 Tax=Purpureocillium lilacinum TaxID=33203 RepID=A0ACC4DRW4_PURLI